MSDFMITDTYPLAQRIDETSVGEAREGTTYPIIPLGTIVRAVDTATTQYGAGEFIYLLGIASTAVGEVVVYNPDDFSTTLAVATQIVISQLRREALTMPMLGVTISVV